jgi:hypothetical protein
VAVGGVKLELSGVGEGGDVLGNAGFENGASKLAGYGRSSAKLNLGLVQKLAAKDGAR